MLNKGDILKERYKIVKVIGKGGSGKVYLGYDLHLKKNWAVKEVPQNKAPGDFQTEREIELLKAICHPAFPRIVDAFSIDGAGYIISDYIEGIGLDIMLESMIFSRKQAYEIANQLLMALHYLHSRNMPILYLDLKPSNILIASSGRVYLVDFGISAYKRNFTSHFGTPGYSPPEQYGINVSDEVDERSDIYAFGVTYFVMRTGASPGQISNLQSYVNLHITERWYIRKCTNNDASKRFAAISDAKKSLDRINFKCGISFKQSATALITLLLISLIFIFTTYSEQKDTPLVEILNEVPPDNDSGGMSNEKLSLIENYINTGKLPYEDEQYYSFEIAREYFENRCDYRMAKRYFLRLDEDSYPQKKYYLGLCNLQTGFDYDRQEIKEYLGEFYEEIMLSKESRDKYSNLLFISFCYEAYLDDANAAQRIIADGKNALADIMTHNSSPDWAEDMMRQYEERVR